MHEKKTLPRRIAKSREVQARTGYSRVQIWRKARNIDDDFPAPLQIGPNRIGWYSEEIDDWLERRPRVRWASANRGRS